MNPRQILKQFEYRLRQAVWPVTGGQQVFGSVAISVQPTPDAIEEFQTPLILLRPGTDRPDPKLPQKGQFTIEGELTVSVAGDILGENALIGANVADLTASEGRGLFWVEQPLKSILAEMLTQDGIRVISRRSGGQRAYLSTDLGYVVSRIYEFTADYVDAPYYHPPQRLVITQGAAGHQILAWADPVTRFDARPTTPLMIRRAAGAVAPATPTAGTLVTRLGLGVGTYNDTPGAGQFSYSLFAAYTDSGNDAELLVSDHEIGSYRTFTGV